MLRFGPDTGPVVMMLLPLFEEHNRTRTFAVTICRALADLGVASVLPDLPGQGESLLPTEAVTIFSLREYVESLADHIGHERKAYIAAIRSGAMLDSFAIVAGRWYLSPHDGPALLKDLTRAKQAQLGLSVTLPACWYLDGDLPDGAPDPAVEIAGNLINPLLLADLEAVSPIDGGVLRIVRLESDPAAADAKFPGAPLWRRSEPGNDPALAALLAADIADWVRQCAG
ncbi:MAG: hypothetical protein B7Y47_11415 [Sphingomonas sp. 28-63-12]|nr:MAG: hypothetical protein B7Y47_11415 [Sphingomonas sp. 28-63-12]